MRIAELSRQTGVSVPTIKYYLREGLLEHGEFTSRNQASYGERHVRRLQLVRTLLEIGRLPISALKEVLGELDNPDPDLHHALGHALMNVATFRAPPTDDETAAATRDTDELITRMGWQVSPFAPARDAVVEVIAALRRLGSDEMLTRLDEYAAAVDRIAELDLEVLRPQDSPEAVVYDAVVGTIIGDKLLAGLRRLAQESASGKAFGVHHAECAVD